MKKIIAAAVILVVLVVMAGCGGGAPVTQEEANEAFGVVFGSYIMSTMAAAFGEPPEGLKVDEESGVVTYKDFDISELETQYTKMSGTVKGSEEAGISADLKLSGGPVKTIKFDITDAENTTEIEIKANGHAMTISPEI